MYFMISAGLNIFMLLWKPLAPVGYTDVAKTQITNTDRDEIFRRYDWICVVCRSQRSVVLHHIIYRSKGKRSEAMSNLAPLCIDCHERVHREGAKKWVPILKNRLSEYE